MTFEGPFQLSDNDSEPKKDEVRRKLNHWSKVASIAAIGMKVLTSTLGGDKPADADVEAANGQTNGAEIKPSTTKTNSPETYHHEGEFRNNLPIENE